MVASKLLGPHGTLAVVTFKRGEVCVCLCLCLCLCVCVCVCVSVCLCSCLCEWFPGSCSSPPTNQVSDWVGVVVQL